MDNRHYPLYSFKIKQGDTKRALKASLFNENDEPIDLMDCLVRFTLFNSTFEKLIDKSIPIEDISGNTVIVKFNQNETDTFGKYRAEIIVVYSDDRVETFPHTGYIEFVIERSSN